MTYDSQPEADAVISANRLPAAPSESMFPRLHQPHESLLSPSIQRTRGESIPAYELKFVVSEDVARRIEAWAEKHLDRDAYAGLHLGGSYQTTTLYLDTPAFDVLHRSPGFRRRKFRLRRYGEELTIFLERKARWSDRVKKRRSAVTLPDLARLNEADVAVGEMHIEHPWSWFRDRIQLRGLRPSCRLTYQRTAFVKPDAAGPLRLTFDRSIRGVPTTDWDLSPVESAAANCTNVLPGQVVCEFKFREAMPALFKDVINDLQLQTGSVSKYRRVMTSDGASEAGAHA